MEWRCIPLGDLSVVQTGIAINKREVLQPVRLPYLRVANVQDGFLDLREIKEITLEEQDVDRYLLRSGDVLFTEGGDFDKLGRGSIWKNAISPCLHQNHVFAVRCKKSFLLPFFLSAVASSPHGRKYFLLSSKQSTNLASINSTQLKKFPIPFPPLSEQKKIARDFYRFFDLPSDWKCSRIRGIARECSERNTQRAKLTVLSCSKHLGFVNSSEYFGKQIFSENTSNYKIIRRGYFGYPSNHIEEGSIGLLANHDIGLVSPIYTVFKCNEKVVPEFLYALFKTDTYRHIFSISTNASVDRRGSLRWRVFSLIKVPNPTKEEQLAIVDVLKTVDDDYILLEKKLKALEKQKRGLMQKLLTGEIRVK